MNGSEKKIDSERDRVTCADLLAAGFRERGKQVLPVQTSDKFTFGAFKRQHSLKAHHGLLAIGAVSVWLNIAVRVPTSKDAAILKKIIWNSYFFKFFSQVVYLAFKFLVFCFKPVVFLLELLELFANENQSLFLNSRTSVFVDRFFDEVKKAHIFSANDQG